MRKALRNFALSLSLLFMILGGSFVNHVAAMSMPHHMEGMNHRSSSSSSQLCATLCSSSITYKEDQWYTAVDREDDQDPEPPYYLLFQARSHIPESLKAQEPTSPDLPLKVPVYIQFGVLRF